LTTPPPPLLELADPPPPRKRSWVSMFSGLAWIILCFELGAFLVVYPWMDGWNQNMFANWRQGWHSVWLSPWFRGAVSGLGALNLIIALVELFRYLRYWLFE
jgi:hypothetical protein